MKVLAGIGIFVYFVVATGSAIDQNLASAGSPPVRKHVSSADVVDGHDVYWWARHSRRNGRLFRQADKDRDARGRTIRRLKRELAHTYAPSFEHYFTIAARAYNVSRAVLEHRGRCESVNFTDFYNDTPIYNGEHAQGVMGFIPSTFNSTPYAGLDLRYDHLANIMAGAYMESRGRGGEWAPVCR